MSSDPQSLIEKANRRAALREEFLKKSSDPFRHAKAEGGVVFDPAIQRFSALRAYFYEYFRPNFKTTAIGMMVLVFPMVGFGYLLKSTRDTREEQLRRGEVCYKDRLNKFI